MGLRHVTLGDIFRRNAQLFPDRTAIVCGFERISHRDYLKRAERLAAGLAAQGVKPGDRIAVAARNCLEFADLYGATALIGAIMLPVNWRLNADEIAYVLADGVPTLVIVGPEDQPTIAGMQEKLPASAKYFGIGTAPPPFRPFTELTGAGASPPAVEVDPDQGYVIIHTAAVDGRPRGALISQTGLLAASMRLVSAWQLDERDVTFVAVPLFHVTGLGQMLTAQLSGGSSVIMAKFDPAECARTIEAEKATAFAEFAPMLMNLPDKAAETGTSLSSLRAVLGLDTAETIGRFEKACPDARFWAVYGQSETSGLVTLSRWRERPDSAGRPTPLSVIVVVDELDQPVATGQVGEIVVRGPMVFCGYWRREEDNKVTFRNGWHHTGDMGRGLSVLRRPFARQGADQAGRRERLSGRGREGDPRTRGDRRGVGDWRARSAMGRSRQGGVRVPVGKIGPGVRLGRVRCIETCALQEAQARGVRRRAAQDRGRCDRPRGRQTSTRRDVGKSLGTLTRRFAPTFPRVPSCNAVASARSERRKARTL